MAFEYRSVVSVDEEIIQLYGDIDNKTNWLKFILEMRVKFIVKGRSEERIIDSERFAVGAPKQKYEDYVRFRLGMRLKDYWIPDCEIYNLITQIGRFAKQIGRSRAGIIPAAMDLEVCTVQREEEEAIGATMERAMRPEFLPPLHLYPVFQPGCKYYPPFLANGIKLVGNLPTVRVEEIQDVDKASSVMEVCIICERKPFVGAKISSLRCGHVFHYHCVAPLLLEDENNSCPVCHRHPIYDYIPKAKSNTYSYWKYSNRDFDSDSDESDHF